VAAHSDLGPDGLSGCPNGHGVKTTFEGTAVNRLSTTTVTDHTLALRRDPYGFISRRAAALETDVFETRLLLRPTVCMTGAAAARVFYDPVRFDRAGAAPAALQKTLFGTGGVQGLDGDEHRHRKAMFLHLNSAVRADALARLVSEEWDAALPQWAEAGQIELYPQVQRMLTRAVCTWAGMPLPDAEVERRTLQLSALFDDAGSAGLGHLRSRAARRSADRWAEQVVTEVRAGRQQTADDSVVAVIANHRDARGQLLDPHVAAVELLNILRPTVATAVYITFVAHALDANPGWRQRCADGDGAEDRAFVEEVRRHYPFFPAVAAIVREDFEWNGHRFHAGRRALLDLFGTNHDPRVWDDPFSFDPERFLGPEPSIFAFVPQGGGEAAVHHRCPGEPISTRLMAVALDQLARRMSYTPSQPDSPLDVGRLPSLPAHGYRMSAVAPRRSDSVEEGLSRSPGH
jgi:fatty-acid peroxygenase